MPVITCLCLAFILGPHEPYKMYLKPFITINKLKKNRIRDIFGSTYMYGDCLCIPINKK